MRMRHATLIAGSIAIAAVLTSASAGAGPPPALSPSCDDVLAKVHTVWIEEATEVGEIDGLINGAIYFSYNDKDPYLDPETMKPNMVITTKTGDIRVWISGSSNELPGGGSGASSIPEASGQGTSQAPTSSWRWSASTSPARAATTRSSARSAGRA